jgi:CheY-like chemotaxis protein
MIIDDDDDLRESVSMLLEMEGYRTIPMARARAALERLGSEPRPDLILLDLMMPGMDGWQFRAEQKKHPVLARIPVVVLTASRNLEEFPLDATAVLLKPFEGTHCCPPFSRVSVRGAGKEAERGFSGSRRARSAPFKRTFDTWQPSDQPSDAGRGVTFIQRDRYRKGNSGRARSDGTRDRARKLKDP